MKDHLKNQELKLWIDEMQALCEPASIHICDGSQEENNFLNQLLIKKGTFIPLASEKRPNSFLARSDPRDVARVESKTFICTKDSEKAGPTNNWCPPEEMKKTLKGLFKGCMKGRTMYVIVFSMGPLGSEISHIGVELTDSAYVVVNMRIMTRMGKEVLDLLGNGSFVKCMHSVGAPLVEGAKDLPWPCNIEKTHIVHFPEENSIWSFGSGYGGNALLGKKCFALRIASFMAREEDWLAEHMLIIGVTNPAGQKKYMAAAFPSGCGKTNMALMQATLPGWKVECLGDDIAWMKCGEDGRLYAINPEAGFFGIAPGTSMQSNPNAMITCAKNAIFTNVALTDEGDVWWEGMTEKAPEHLIDWLGREWKAGSKEPAAHPNSRFTVTLQQCPSLDSSWNDPKGVPISALIFGGRRADTMPLVCEAKNWEHGVLIGASISSERTAAAEGERGTLRHDPFAMLPFCGYNMAEYFSHWLHMKDVISSSALPSIFSVNWFQKNEKGDFIWPGFGENIRILKWIFERTENRIGAEASIIGLLPKLGDIDIRGLAISEESMKKLFSIDHKKWAHEVEEMEHYLSQFKTDLPKVLEEELEQIREHLYDE